MNVETVRGPVKPSDLGITDYHDHLYVEPPRWLHRMDPDFALDSVENSAAELKTWIRAGGRTICELTAVDFGRNVHKLREVAELVPEAHIILTAGYNRPYYMGRWLHAVSEDDMVRDTVRDLTVGIDGTEVKAGIIKAGSEYNNFNEGAQKLFRVAARAHLETGRPIITHTSAGTMGLDQAGFLIEHGVPASRIALSHMDRNPDFGEHQQVARTGVFLGFDSFGKAKYGPEGTRIELLRRLIDAGFGRQLLIGNDIGRPSYWRQYGGGPGLDFVLTQFIPRLKTEGFSDAEIQMLLIDNPRRLLGGDDSQP